MPRMLRISLNSALLLGLLINVQRMRAQEPATIDSEPAVRFEQGGGYYNYAAFCRTPKDNSAQMPKSGLPIDQIEFAIGWYVKASVTHAGGASPEMDGRIVVSQHHVRFMPANPQSAEHYADMPRGDVELQHSPGEPGGSLRGKDIVVRFELRKICQTCAAAAAAPADSNAALLDKEFALLNDTITHFESGWRTTYRMSKGDAIEMPSGNQPASTAAASRTSPGLKQNVSLTTGASPAVSFASSAPGASAAAPSARASAPAMGLTIGKPVKIASGAADGLLVRKVPPSYPLEAKLVRLEGTVVLHAIIDRAGEVSQVNALSGPPLLESAAVDAVRQWQYKPYAVNGQAVDVETTIQVVFALDGNRPATHAQTARNRQ